MASQNHGVILSSQMILHAGLKSMNTTLFVTTLSILNHHTVVVLMTIFHK